ncbi:hypothetical protein FZC66_18290 [Priestia megaterium]|nr:hypothetical protein FZC66_18290 [Priestia megaterium]
MIALFLYFPEDKSEYIPAFIWMGIFTVGAVLAWRFVIVISRKEEQKAKQLEEEMIAKKRSNSSKF